MKYYDKYKLTHPKLWKKFVAENPKLMILPAFHDSRKVRSTTSTKHDTTSVRDVDFEFDTAQQRLAQNRTSGKLGLKQSKFYCNR